MARQLEISVVSGQGAGGLGAGWVIRLFVRTSRGWPSHLPLLPSLTPLHLTPQHPAPSWPEILSIQPGELPPGYGDGLAAGRGPWVPSRGTRSKGWRLACALALCDLERPPTLSGPQFSLLKNKNVAPWSAVQASTCRLPGVWVPEGSTHLLTEIPGKSLLSPSLGFPIY